MAEKYKSLWIEEKAKKLRRDDKIKLLESHVKRLDIRITSLKFEIKVFRDKAEPWIDHGSKIKSEY